MRIVQEDIDMYPLVMATFYGDDMEARVLEYLVDLICDSRTDAASVRAKANHNLYANCYVSLLIDCQLFHSQRKS